MVNSILHFLSQAGAAGGAVADQRVDDLGRHVLQRGAARVTHQVVGFAAGQGIAAEGLRQPAALDLRLAVTGSTNWITPDPTGPCRSPAPSSAR